MVDVSSLLPPPFFFCGAPETAVPWGEGGGVPLLDVLLPPPIFLWSTGGERCPTLFAARVQVTLCFPAAHSSHHTLGGGRRGPSVGLLLPPPIFVGLGVRIAMYAAVLEKRCSPAHPTIGGREEGSLCWTPSPSPHFFWSRSAHCHACTRGCRRFTDRTAARRAERRNAQNVEIALRPVIRKVTFDTLASVPREKKSRGGPLIFRRRNSRYRSLSRGTGIKKVHFE